MYAGFQLVASHLRGFGHFLLLQRVHAAESAHRLLITRHGALTFLATFILTFDIAQHVVKTAAEFFQVKCIHIQNNRHKPLRFEKTVYL